ncbi:MAG: 2-oxo acid dehydrogenase subunit E2, partial [Clostridia bacterium]|nr:2-oxo acid dehydrogenase subunit E2 [Clostridia bacterium]
LKSIDPMSAVSAYIMPHRNGASNQFNASLDITEAENFVRQKRAEGKKGLGLMHVVLAAYVRTVASYPGINRFIRGQKLYARNNIDMCLTIKKEMALNAPETVIKIPASADDTIDNVYATIMKLIEENRDLSASNGMDFAAKFLSYIPGVFLKFAVWLLKFLDYFGLLPKALVKVSPFHGSMYLTNLGSLGIDPVYHHLYDFGNLPLFCAMGKKRTEYKLNADGTVRKIRMMDITMVCDERICDGHYYAAAFKTLKKHIENPHLLDSKPEKVVCDIK